jgi:hypothetical protein
MYHKYTRELLEGIVKQSSTTSDVIRLLGLRQSGGNHSHIKGRIAYYNIDTSHFKKQTDFLKPGMNKRNAESVLVLRTSGNREKASVLRRALIESNVEYRCSDKTCPVKDHWNGKSIVLEVNHKNGDWLDNRKDNLEFLCPNCHSQYTIHEQVV